MSLVDQILGRGAVAEFCLWKNKIISGIVLVMATISWCILEIMETRLVQFLCSIWLLLMLLLFIWVKFGQLLFTRRPPTPEEIRKRGTPFRVLFLRTERLFLRLYVIAYGEDIKTSLWAILYVAIIHTIGSKINLLTILYICLVSSMTIPVLYLKNQVVIDNFIGELSEVKNKTLQIFQSRVTKKKNVTPQTPTANANGSSTSMANGPFTSTANRLFTSTANRPSTSMASGPSTSTANVPSTSTANGPSTPTTNGPSTSMANEPPAPTANEPHTPTASGPSAPMANGPPASTVNGSSTANEPSDNDGPSRHSVRRFRLFRRSVR
ncbi:reticulon-like protein B15 [Raphanus sativus]|uniref:Reticulon-like protein n=1 Tax=Raphanus sativus TaxID=3726 RepID=A0A6J0JJC0_RAPSA|nr:reticulon-like protein B15 [Raphanus sativus]